LTVLSLATCASGGPKPPGTAQESSP
jgi:hypothetical protein